MFPNFCIQQLFIYDKKKKVSYWIYNTFHIEKIHKLHY